MKTAPSFDRELGMWYYATETCPSGGVIKKRVEDFVVEEILRDGVLVSTSGVSLAPRIGNWTWIHVVKHNVDTLKLMLSLAKSLNVRLSEISVGGIKDARAITSQIISVRKHIDALPTVPNVKFLGMWSMDRPITPSEIYGNKFTIVLRDVDRVDCVLESLAALNDVAIPNYYGYQRFGTVRPVSHLLGRALLKKDPESFYEVMFCRIFPHESEAAKRARELACRGEHARALETFPKKFVEERLLLRKLTRGSDLWNAIMAIPTNILKMYIEAVQSHIFNLFLSKRMELGPLDTPIEGDLVEVNRQVSHYVGLGNSVVLPIVGIGVRMPRGKVGEALAHVLKEEGVEFNFLKMPRGLRAYGSYRKAKVEMSNFVYSIDGRNVTLQFTLPRGSYATVVLREVVKPEEPHLHGF